MNSQSGQLPDDVELTRHVTLTLHTQNNMAGNMDVHYLFGEDFKVILDILEGDQDLEKSTN